MTFSAIQTKTTELGFDAFGVCAPTLPAEITDGLEEFIELGYHGDMGWMETRKQLRRSPEELWPEAKSVIVVGHNYAPEFNPLEKLKDKHIGNISAYALGDDYHDVIKKKLKQLARWLVETYDCEVKLFVDTAPVMEKPLAELAGIGWQGKHTCIISREHGCWLFLGVVFTTLEIPLNEKKSPRLRGDLGGNNAKASPPSPPASGGDNSCTLVNEENYSQGSCGTCTRCIDICPTDAIIAPHKIDARKCISYLTIEHQGHIPVEYRKAIGNRIYGCDDCLAICPWNKFAETTQEAKYHSREALKSPSLEELAQLDDATFRKLFSKSPIKRTGRNRFVRNVCIAIGNTGDKRYLPILDTLVKDENELVREAASWAVGEINVSLTT